MDNRVRPNSSQIITVSHCPHCNSYHQYQLEVQRSFAVSELANTSSVRTLQPTRRKFMRSFICPQKKQFFPFQISLLEESNDPIVSVKVRTYRKRTSVG